jgi:hypothetical protein
MRCILDHGKLTLVAESNFEEGYLGELLENKMQGTAKRDTLGNISQIEFFKKDISSEEGRTAIIDSVRNGIPLPITELDNDYYNESEEMEPVTDEEYENAEKWEIIEELDDQSNEEILTGINELNAEYDEGDLIPRELSIEEVNEFVNDRKSELEDVAKDIIVEDMFDELDSVEDDMTIIPRTIKDLGDIDIYDGLDDDIDPGDEIDNMVIDFDKLNDELDLEDFEDML